jgi:hypothetical protein
VKPFLETFFLEIARSMSTEWIANEIALRAIHPVYPVMGGVRQHPRGAEATGNTRSAIDSRVDRAFLVKVLLISAVEQFL